MVRQSQEDVSNSVTPATGVNSGSFKILRREKLNSPGNLIMRYAQVTEDLAQRKGQDIRMGHLPCLIIEVAKEMLVFS